MARLFVIVPIFCNILYARANCADRQDGATGCAAKPRTANALLQYDTGIHDIEQTPRAMHLDKQGSLREDFSGSSLSNASKRAKKIEPLIKKIEVLSTEVDGLEAAVTKLEDGIGMAHKGEAPTVEGLLEQNKEKAATQTLGAHQAAHVQTKHHASTPKREFKFVALVDVTQNETEEELMEEETMKQQVASLEQRMSSVTSRTENLENEVWGQAAESFAPKLAQKRVIHVGGETSLKDRVLNLEFKVDNVKMRVAQLQHQVVG